MEAIDITKKPPNYPANKHSSHSFSHRPSCAQIIAYLVIGGEYIVYFTCIMDLLGEWVVSGLYIGTGVLMLAFAIVASCSNPTD